VNAPIERLLSLKEVALRLGVSVRKIYRLVHDGALRPPVKMGRSARIPETEVAAYIETLKRNRGPGYSA